MATQYANGRIVTDGLVLNLNAADPNSYPGSGTTWTDISGNGNNGTLVNGPSFSSANGGSIVFDGTNDWLNLPTAGFGLANLSVEFWIKFNNSGGFFWVIADSTGGNPELRLTFNGSNIRMLWYDSGTYFFDTTTNASISTGVWYHFANTTTNNDYRFYVNGVLDKALTGTTYNGGTLACHSIATYNLYGTTPGYSGYSAMSLGSYKFYNRVLSPAEVAQNYNAQKARFGLK